MEKLYIEKTKTTPQIVFDPENSTLRIEGQSYPENAFKFYQPIFKWLDTQLAEVKQEIVLEIYFHMPYINTSSSKCVMMLLEKLEDAYQEGKKIVIRWYYHVDNEMALECAEEFKEDLTLPFEINSVQDAE